MTCGTGVVASYDLGAGRVKAEASGQSSTLCRPADQLNCNLLRPFSRFSSFFVPLVARLISLSGDGVRANVAQRPNGLPPFSRENERGIGSEVSAVDR